MTNEELQLLVIRRAIASATADEQVQIESAAQKLRQVLAEHGDCGRVALALIGAELAAETP